MRQQVAEVKPDIPIATSSCNGIPDARLTISLPANGDEACFIQYSIENVSDARSPAARVSCWVNLNYNNHYFDILQKLYCRDWVYGQSGLVAHKISCGLAYFSGHEAPKGYFNIQKDVGPFWQVIW